MGVDWKVCQLCEETYPDCGPTQFCEGCKTTFCGYCKEAEIGETCPLCRYEMVTPDAVLAWAIVKYKLPPKKELEELYRKDMLAKETSDETQ